MTEVRTVSDTGGEKGVKPRTFHLLPWHALGVIAEHFGIGAKKYAAHNWRRGYEWSKSFSALQRHLADWWEGEERDEDGLHNLAAAGFHVLVLITFAVVDRGRYGRFDDRYKEPEPEFVVPKIDVSKLARGGYVGTYVGTRGVDGRVSSMVELSPETREMLMNLSSTSSDQIIASRNRIARGDAMMGRPVKDMPQA